MFHLFAVLDEPDACMGLLVIGIILTIGSKVAEHRPQVRERGFYLAALGTVGYVFYRAVLSSPQDSPQWIGLLIQGALVGGLLLGLSWLVLPLISGLLDVTIAKPWKVLCNLVCGVSSSWSRNSSQRREQREQARRQVEYEKSAPDRERISREAAAVQRKKEETLVAHQRRREEARARCELVFNLHAADIGARFTRKMFDDFIAKFMTDRHEVEDVERRGRELQQLIEQHRDQIKPISKPRTLSDLANWFVAERDRIAAMAIDEDLKEEHLVYLNVRYSELSNQLLQKLEP